MCCYSLLVCSNNVCVCVGGVPVGEHVCACCVEIRDTLGIISQVWTSLHFEIWSLAVGDRVSLTTPMPPAPGLQAYATMHNCF